MFLILTADPQFWRTDRQVLFLGEWCRRRSHEDAWQHLDAEVLPYHWDERQKLHRDREYLVPLYEASLQVLAGSLNRLHGASYPIRYWRIVVGPWLQLFVNVLFDRFESIRAAETSGQVTGCHVGEYAPNQWLFRDKLELTQAAIADGYNGFLFSEIIRRRRRLPFVEVAPVVRQGAPGEGVRRPSRASVRRLAMTGFQALSRWIPESLNRVTIVNSGLTPSDLARLQLSLRQLPFLLAPAVPTPFSEPHPASREALFPFEARNDFEELLRWMLPQQIPTVYVEGYERMQQLALEAYPRRPSLIHAAGSFDHDEAFKFWAAFQSHHGCPFTGAQHGAYFGTARFLQEEEHQIQVTDRYYTWGWTSDWARNTKPLAAAKFNRALKVRPAPDGRILFTTFAWPRYSYKLQSTVVSASGMLRYFDETYAFAELLSADVRKLLLVRTFPDDRDWDQVNRWRARFPDVECDGGRAVSLFAHMRQSRLLVTLATSTPFLEALAADFPVVGFFNPAELELRESAQPDFARLAEVGIVHETPEGAAAKVNEIGHAPDRWWQTREVQEARRQFCERYARTSANWLHEWKREFGSIKRGSGASETGQPVTLPATRDH